MKAASACRACARVTGQPKSSQLPGCAAKRVRTSDCTACVIASGAKRGGGGTSTGAVAAETPAVVGIEVPRPPSGCAGSAASISTRWRRRISR